MIRHEWHTKKHMMMLAHTKGIIAAVLATSMLLTGTQGALKRGFLRKPETKHVAPPTLPDHFKIEAEFAISSWESMKGYLLWQNEDNWCFQTTAQILSSVYPAAEDGTVSMKQFFNYCGIDAFAWTYLRRNPNIPSHMEEPPEDGFEDCPVWFDEPIVEMWTERRGVLHDLDMTDYFCNTMAVAAYGMAEALVQLPNLKATVPKTIEGEDDLLGWRAPEKVWGGEINATFYFTQDGNLRFLELELIQGVPKPPSDNGLPAILSVKFENLVPADEEDLIVCSPPADSE